jgi:RNA polymerase sigma factor (sigma-70 family)
MIDLNPAASHGWKLAMTEHGTTLVIQEYLNRLPAKGPQRALAIQSLLERAAKRLKLLCTGMLHKRYPRLTEPPLNLDSEEMLGGVVARLLTAMKNIQPRTTRELFALATQHMVWELNALARRLDEQPVFAELDSQLVPAPPSSDSGLSFGARRILEAIEMLPIDEGEVVTLVHIQGLTQAEIARMLDVDPKTIKRRLVRGLAKLAKKLDDLRPN